MSDIEIIHNILLTSRQMLRETGSEPTPEELAEKLGMPLEKVHKTLKIAKEPILLETRMPSWLGGRARYTPTCAARQVAPFVCGGRPAGSRRHPWPHTRSPPNLSRNTSASSGLAKQNTTTSLSSRRMW
jgi:hypothetical protein